MSQNGLMSPRRNLKRLVENALDFLERAFEDLQRSPKYSVINFYAAVELFLKARLLAEHWTLAISKRQDADLRKFESGDFQSVTLEEAADRLEKVVQSPLSATELKLFKDLAKHRNRMMHFYHEAIDPRAAQAVKKAVATEQLRAWYVLNRLLLDRWGGVFKPWRTELERLTTKLRGHRTYLQVSFDAVKQKLQEAVAQGAAIEECPACGYIASRVEDSAGLVKDCACAVCEMHSAQVTVPCPKCHAPVRFVGEGFAACSKCATNLEPKDLAEALDEDEHGTKDYFESGMPAHCTHCGGYQTVVHHGGHCVCISCLTVFDESELEQCGYCGDLNAGELENSVVTGCVACDGSMPR